MAGQRTWAGATGLPFPEHLTAVFEISMAV